MLGAVVLKYVYGRDIDVSAREDVLFSAATRSARAAGEAVMPGRWLVNSLPALQFLPEWFPGCYFRSVAREVKECVKQIIDGGYEEALRCMVSTESCFWFWHISHAFGRHSPGRKPILSSRRWKPRRRDTTPVRLQGKSVVLHTLVSLEISALNSLPTHKRA